ncbi:MAG: hypothetical protein GX772_10495 [Alcaligenaceae bacterium]|nr:hypothetical protein [Alcaligenaceae bacterium]
MSLAAIDQAGNSIDTFMLEVYDFGFTNAVINDQSQDLIKRAPTLWEQIGSNLITNKE